MSRTVGSSIVTKCGRIIDLLVESRGPLAFSDIVDATGYAKSSAHRILSVLLSEQLVHYNSVARSYSIGGRVQGWARSSLQRTDLQKIAAKELEQLSVSTSLNVALSVLDNNSVLYIRTFDGFHMRFAARPGDRAALHNTAAGKVFLSYMSAARREKFMSEAPFERYTEHTIVDANILIADIAQVRERGYGFSEREELSQMLGIAAPIWGVQGDVAACASVWSVAERTSADEMRELSAELLATTKNISKRLV